MKGFVRLMAVVVTAAAFAVACSKDKDSGKITLDSPAVFFAQAGGSATVGFTAQNIKTLSATSKPTGWDEAVVDLAGATISVKAPSAEDIESGDAVKTGSFSFTGYTPGGTLVSATLFAGIVTTKDISAEVANSYIVSEPETNYLIDATRKSDGSLLATSYVDVVWQTASGFVQYADFEDGKASFYIGADSDDATKIKQGNAVIGAYNADDELIWSWHIWATDYDPDAEGGTVVFNDYTLMNRNLGAQANDNSTTDKILASYGLYYQWGRKDPFIGPNTYQGSEGSGASMYSGSGSRVYLKMSESSAETGTMEYAIRNPLVFITGVADTDNDWLWSGRSDQLWSADDNVADKSVNDPCPYGWRVAPSGAFADLRIVGTPAVGDEAKYGWTLTDGSAESFFLGAGRRRYDNGKILNIYNPLPKVRSDAMEAQPWEGLYWTTAVSGTQAAALHFWFEKLDTSAGIDDSAPYARANGLQVRCVKQQGK